MSLLSDKDYRRGTDANLVDRLVGILKKHRRLMRQPLIAKWEQEFGLLRAEHDLLVIEETLTRYSDRFGEPGLPRCFSAKSFRENFRQLRTKLGVLDPMPPEMLDLARSIYQERAWPCGLESFMAYVWEGQQFFSEFKRICREDMSDPFSDHLVLRLGTIPLHLREWFAAVHRSADWYEDCGLGLAPTFKHPVFNIWGRKLAIQFSGSPDLWNRLVREYAN